MRALFARFPSLVHAVPHVDLGVEETPVERWSVDGATLLIKRDDLSAPGLGGNKVRALEFLLARARPGRTLLTIGSTGSTHALSVAAHASRFGDCEVITWPQEEHDVSRRTSARLGQLARVTAASSPATAWLRAAGRRVRRDVQWISAGGSTPVGALGHVNAALELVEQCARRHEELPDVIVVPVGSGGTIAGLLAGFALARVRVRIVGVRVVPGVVANRWRVVRLAQRAHALVERGLGQRLPGPDGRTLEIEGRAYGGGYARETEPARAAAAALAAAGGPHLDGTYSAKAFGVALDRAKRAPDTRVLFWLTFDGRWLAAARDRAAPPRGSSH